MSKNKWYLAIIVLILVVASLWISQTLLKKGESKDKPQISKLDGNYYWTCPMHPQIHMDHAGECPICHMKLVKVSDKIPEQSINDNRSSVQATPSQLALLGIQKSLVEKMDLHPVVPVSGRVLNSSSIAFQVYENDLRYIHPGLQFTGEGSIQLDEEISGVISSVDSIVDPTSRTVRVVGRIEKGPKRLLSETSFRGDIKLELKNRIAIPESSVLHAGNADLVYLFNDGNKLTPTVVKLGMKADGFYEVLSGLNAGEAISSGPNFLIDSEAKIRGASGGTISNKLPECPSDQHWDIPMAMCMPGKTSK